MIEASSDWARCRGWIEASLKRSGGFYEVSDIAQMIENGQLQFWPMSKAFALTEVIIYPNGKAVNVFLSGGELKQLREFERHISEIAEENGCRWVLGHAARKGWIPVTAKAGYRVLSYILIKEIP